MFTQLLQEYGPLFWLAVIISFFIGFLLARLLVVPALRDYRKRLKAGEQALKEAERQKQEAREAVEKCRAEAAELQSRLQSKEQLIAVWQKEARDCEDKLHREEEQGKAFKEQCDQMESRLFEALKQLDACEQQRRELTAKNEALEKENQRLAEQLSTGQIALEQIAQMQSTLNASIQRLGELESRISTPQAASPTVEAESYQPPATAVQEQEGYDVQKLESILDTSTKELLPEDEVERAKAAVKTSIGKQIPKAPKGAQDDLTQIQGIGPFIEAQLNELGICTYQQIAAMDEAFIQALTEAIRYIPGRIQKDRWVEQAAKLASAKPAKKERKPKAKAPAKKKKTAASAAPAKKKTAANAKRDDLKIVEGIGPKIEEVLNKAGIKTWAQLARQTPKRLREILASAGKRFIMHQPDTWPKQASLAAQGKWKELKELQDKL